MAETIIISVAYIFARTKSIIDIDKEVGEPNRYKKEDHLYYSLQFICLSPGKIIKQVSLVILTNKEETKSQCRISNAAFNVHYSSDPLFYYTPNTIQTFLTT
jgi:hypothetical protein